MRIVPSSAEQSAFEDATPPAPVPPRRFAQLLFGITVLLGVAVLVAAPGLGFGLWNLLPLAVVGAFVYRTMDRNPFNVTVLTPATTAAALAVLVWVAYVHVSWLTDFQGFKSGRSSSGGIFFVAPIWAGLFAGAVGGAVKLLHLLVQKALGANV